MDLASSRAAAVFIGLAIAGAAGACAADPAGPGASPRAAGAPRVPRIHRQESGTRARLQAVSPVDERVVWASGVGGTWALTTDGGATWRARVVPGAEALEFRDVHGVSRRVAYLLAAGEGSRSRIYKTEDGGDNWALLFENHDPARFFDCFAFWSPTRGVAVADSIAARFPAIQTTDGRSWREMGDRLPDALPGESAFAASGTCVAALGASRAWILTGGAERARVLATVDGGATWAAHDAPMARRGQGAGGFSIAFRDPLHGIAGGGSLEAPAERSSSVLRTDDGGRTWRPAAQPPFPGAIYALSYAQGRGGAGAVAVVATGPGGAAWTADEGGTWSLLPGVSGCWAVAFAGPRLGWLVGTDGRILRIEL